MFAGAFVYLLLLLLFSELKLPCGTTRHRTRKVSKEGVLFRPEDLIRGHSLGNGFFGQVYLVSIDMTIYGSIDSCVDSDSTGDRFYYRQ